MPLFNILESKALAGILEALERHLKEEPSVIGWAVMHSKAETGKQAQVKVVFADGQIVTGQGATFAQAAAEFSVKCVKNRMGLDVYDKPSG